MSRSGSGIPAVSLRVGVPHYLGNAKHPQSSAALLSHLEKVVGIPTGHAALAEDAMRWRSLHDEAVAEDDHASSYVAMLEHDYDRKAEADLFVSVHANAIEDRAMQGSAVYVLSERGASSEQARWIANHENAADLVGGVELQKQDDSVAAVLIDISQGATMEASFDLGGRLGLGHVAGEHRHHAGRQPQPATAGAGQRQSGSL